MQSGFQGVGAEWVVEVGGRDYQGWGGWHGRKRWVRGRTAELQAGHGEARKRRRLPSLEAQHSLFMAAPWWWCGGRAGNGHNQ